MKLTLRSTRNEAPDVRSFVFDPDIPVDFRTGQHVSIMLPIEQPDVRGNVRMFTVSSSSPEGMIMIMTKRGPSTFKKALFALSIGSVVEARNFIREIFGVYDGLIIASTRSVWYPQAV
jgi:ferredoxin-NADP reductase